MASVGNKLEARKDQVVGAVKEHIPATRAEGAAQRDRGDAALATEHAKGQAQSAAHRAEGAVKSAAGGLTGDRHLQAEGESARARGDAERRAN